MSGARSYIAFSGGIDIQSWLGSKSTFHKAGVGGVDGYALKEGQKISLRKSEGVVGKRIKSESIPEMTKSGLWEIEVVRGPNDDWLDENGYKTFLQAEWKLQARSDRTGFRLDGPPLTFTEKATDKSPEHGYEPSNIIDLKIFFSYLSMAFFLCSTSEIADISIYLLTAFSIIPLVTLIIVIQSQYLSFG